MQFLDETVKVLLLCVGGAESLLGRSLYLPQAVNSVANRALDVLTERFYPFLISRIGWHTIPRLTQPKSRLRCCGSLLWLLYTMCTSQAI
jgi:hypothetical protein